MMAENVRLGATAVVTNEDILKLSGLLTRDGKDVARYLGVPEEKLDDIEDGNQNRRKEANMEMLKAWKKLKGESATYAALTAALREAGRIDLAEMMPH